VGQSQKLSVYLHATPLNYVQMVDCSAALYAHLQAHAVCPPAKTGALQPKVDSGPFCSDYHLAQGQGSNKMSSMYYFLQASDHYVLLQHPCNMSEM